MEFIKQKQFVDVTEPPFNAVGDCKNNDARAFQQAVDSLQGVEARLQPVEPRTNPNEEQRS